MLHRYKDHIVDVRVMNGLDASQGGSAPTMRHANNTTAAAGVTQLVAAPGAGQSIVVSSMSVQNESAVATLVMIRQGAVTAYRKLLQTQGANMTLSFHPDREWVLPVNTALQLWLGGANLHNYDVDYYVR